MRKRIHRRRSKTRLKKLMVTLTVGSMVISLASRKPTLDKDSFKNERRIESRLERKELHKKSKIKLMSRKMGNSLYIAIHLADKKRHKILEYQNEKYEYIYEMGTHTTFLRQTSIELQNETHSYKSYKIAQSTEEEYRRDLKKLYLENGIEDSEVEMTKCVLEKIKRAKIKLAQHIEAKLAFIKYNEDNKFKKIYLMPYSYEYYKNAVEYVGNQKIIEQVYKKQTQILTIIKNRYIVEKFELIETIKLKI